MMSEKTAAKLVLLEHSKAKVELNTSYLAAYLNILSRVPFITRIHIGVNENMSISKIAI